MRPGAAAKRLHHNAAGFLCLTRRMDKPGMTNGKRANGGGRIRRTTEHGCCSGESAQPNAMERMTRSFPDGRNACTRNRGTCSDADALDEPGREKRAKVLFPRNIGPAALRC